MILEWLNENSFRSYPLKEYQDKVGGSLTLLDPVILDALFVYTTTQTDVQLVQIVADATNITFTITGSLSFVVPRASVFPYYARLSQGSLLVVGAECLNIPNATYNFTNVFFEDSVVYEFNAAWAGVSSITFDTLKTGVINLIEGYQFGVDMNGEVLSLFASPDYGIPVGCESFDILPDDCDDIVSFINGAIPDDQNKVVFNPGDKITIVDDPTNNRIFVGLTFQPDDVCTPPPNEPNSSLDVQVQNTVKYPMPPNSCN